ncbi:metallophosphoesterase [Ornithinibacillus bavariensis]|uniref:Phosphoesterase n=1 Tax=Ornithinibacillus bavariensis TaxID=545502 RepID=A0A919X416_9BACI|nr:metallophosphoesterase [Ornithinibacillus bavariensis]GIO25461.1 phosphoesterase [Ornithinibacillus bavariensis]
MRSPYPKKFKRKMWLFLGTLLILGTSAKAYFDTNVFKINKVQFQTNKIAAGSKITVLQISDVHNKISRSQHEKLIEAVIRVNPDVIVLTGDLVDRTTADLTNVFLFIEQLVEVNQNTFFVTGNHERDNSNVDELLAGLADCGVTVLSNSNTEIMIRDSTINLVGIDNESTNHENMNLAFSGIKHEKYTILLSHSPGVVMNYQDIPADLILSGHTHGGQIRLPLVGAIVAPNQGYFPKYDKGTFEIGSEQYIYIDSGLGTSVAPVRFWNQSQISLIEINGSN